MIVGSRVRRTQYDLSSREALLMQTVAFIGTVVAIAGGIVEVQWDHRTKGKTNRYFVGGQRIRLAEAA